jgi:hypothetical protein
MAPNERPRQIHHALFPNHVSALATTDPELVDVFDNVAFDEVLQGSTLHVRTRLMVQYQLSKRGNSLRVMAEAAKGPADWFTGSVRIDSRFQRPAPARIGGATVTFEPGGRTAANRAVLWLVAGQLSVPTISQSSASNRLTAFTMSG